MMKRLAFVLLALLSLSGGAHAQFSPQTFGFGFGSQASSNTPLNLPLVQESDLPSMFTFLGSFKLPSQTGCTGTLLYNATTSMWVSGSTMLIGENLYDPYNGSMYLELGGQASVTIPTLSGTPAYDGTNGCATVNWGPSGAVNITAPASYTFMATPSAGATTATFVSVPPGIAPVDANGMNNWFVRFGTSEDHAVTAVSGSNVTWSGGCSACSASVQVYQWERLVPYGYAAGTHATGAMVYNGKLYQTGVAYYDAGCRLNEGWLTSATTSGTGWSAVNTVSNYPAGLGADPALASRNFAGQLSAVPSIWQALLGGPVSVMSGLGGISNISCNVPYGFQLSTFDPATATGGVAVRVNTLIDYLPVGATTDATPTSITGRVLAGPFPLCVAASACESGYFPATLSAAPTAGAITASFSLPASNVVVTANLTSGSNSMVITAVNSGGPISGSAIYYSSTDTAGCINGAGNVSPSYEAGPTRPVGPGTYTLHDASKCTATDDTVTLTPHGYASGFYTIIFTDLGGGTETRIVHLAHDSAAIPNATAGTNDPTTFAIQGTQSLTANQPLVCSGGCSASVQVAPMGDANGSVYDGPFGAGFILPGTRSLLMLNQHQYGPTGPRADPCKGGASGTNEMPIAPDTGFYDQIQISAYDMAQVIGAANVWTPTPYGNWTFPGEAALHNATGCIGSNGPSWAYYDPSTSRLYMSIGIGVHTNASTGIVYVWQVNSMFLMLLAIVRGRRSANDDRFMQEAA